MIKYPIIILHGWNLSGRTFYPLADVIKRKKYTSYSPDLPGFGENNKLEKVYTLDDYVDYLKNFIKVKKLGKVILICHSFGGRIGIKYAAANTDRVHLLILSGVPGLPPVSSVKVKLFYIISKIGKIIFKIGFLQKYSLFFRKNLYKAAKSTDYYKTSGFLKDTFQNIIKEDLFDSMKQIRNSTILIWGEKDNTVPVSIAGKMKKIIMESKLEIIMNENHKVPYNSPEIFFTIVEQNNK